MASPVGYTTGLVLVVCGLSVLARLQEQQKALQEQKHRKLLEQNQLDEEQKQPLSSCE